MFIRLFQSSIIEDHVEKLERQRRADENLNSLQFVELKVNT